jgi:3-hydroxyisobutyrate dehydrogenase-like beta-hydroxyacid dehydrogenase
VDCPISGGPKGARAGTLTVIVAGPGAAKEELRPWLQRIGKNVFEVGEKPGQALLMKLGGERGHGVRGTGAGGKGRPGPGPDGGHPERAHRPEQHDADESAQSVLPGTFDYGSSLTIMLKDVVLGLQEAEALGVPMWVHGTVGQLWRFAEQQELGPADFTSLIKVMEGWAGVEVRGRAS